MLIDEKKSFDLSDEELPIEVKYSEVVALEVSPLSISRAKIKVEKTDDVPIVVRQTKKKEKNFIVVIVVKKFIITIIDVKVVVIKKEKKKNHTKI